MVAATEYVAAEVRTVALAAPEKVVARVGVIVGTVVVTITV